MYVSKQEGSYVNILTPAYVLFIPGNYLLELFHLYLFGPSGSGFAYALTYACYAVYFVARGVSYLLRAPTIRLPWSFSPRGRRNLLPYGLLLLAVALYLPVIYEFRALLATPRAIYMATRLGYGVYWVLSATLCYLAFISLLLKRHSSSIEISVFALLCALVLWFQGSKYHLLILLFIYVMYRVYLKRERVSLWRFSIFAGLMAAIGFGLFFIVNPELVMEDGLLHLSEYSSYSRNGMLVIDSDLGPLYGRLMLETQLFARIPRPLMPDKPTDWGAFYLAKHFYPEAYEANTGAPDFGYGVMFADFGVFTLFVVLLTGFVDGYLLRIFVNGTLRYRQPGYFILLLFGAGVQLVPIGGVYLLPEMIILAILANALQNFGARGLSVAAPPAAS